MIEKPVDPRYTNVEDLQPVYRVDFWDADGASEEWRLTEALHVHEVLSWADRHSKGREASICVEYEYQQDGERTVVLLRLSGPEPA